MVLASKYKGKENGKWLIKKMHVISTFLSFPQKIIPLFVTFVDLVSSHFI